MNTLVISGNLVDDPELRFTPNGQAVARFRIGSTERYFDRQANDWKDGDTLFITCNVWREQAENAAESLRKGTRVNVTGRLKQRSYEVKEGEKQGEKRTVYEIEVDDVSPSLRAATAQVTRTRKNDQGAPDNWQNATRQRPSSAPAPAGPADQNWSTAPGTEAGWPADQGQPATAGAPAGAPPAGTPWNGNGYGYGGPGQSQGQPGQPPF